jgi:NitT/TauT family transport system substrate-binding protein
MEIIRPHTMLGEDQTAPAVSRKALLSKAGFGAGALVLGSAIAASPTLARRAAPGLLKSRKTYQVNYGGATCEAFTYAAFAKHLWTHEGINVEIHLSALGVPPISDLSSGTIAAAPSNFYSYLKPLEQGADIRVTAGLHGGCLRLVVGAASGIKTYADLKGKTIGTNGVNNAPSPFFSVALAKAGVNPINDVRWRTYLPAEFGPALEKGEIQAVAAIDPAPYVLVQQGKAMEIGSNMTGMFAYMFCCAAGLSGKLVRDEPKVAAAITRGLMHGSVYTGHHVHEIAAVEVKDKFVSVSLPTAEHLLASYTWKPSASLIKGQLEQGARDFQLTGILLKSTDPMQLADKAYVDIFKLAGESA